MEIFKNIKFCLGPMSKNIVDTTIDFCETNNLNMILIPSRRQIEYNGGYVNNWTTKTFYQYVKQKTNKIYFERDHGGPGQGLYDDDGLESFADDCLYFDIIHIDPWKKYDDYENGLQYTVDLINYCYNLNNNIYFEVATEEAIRPFNVDILRKLMTDLKQKLEKNIYDRIVYLVIQSGTALKVGTNIGNYNDNRLKDMVKLSNEFNILSKEHNGDWLSDFEVKDKFNNKLDAINIAPEFGMIETDVILSNLKEQDKHDEIEKFFEICYQSKKWIKWVDSDFDPFQNKEQLIRICGHYVFTNDEFIKIKSELNDIDQQIKTKLNSRLKHLYNLV